MQQKKNPKGKEQIDSAHRTVSVDAQAEVVDETLRELGYVPCPASGDKMEFYRDYADEEGRLARVTVFFDRPFSEMKSVRLAGVAVTTQMISPPEMETLEREAPAITHRDLGCIIDAFAHSGREHEQVVMARTCIHCAKLSNQFYVVNEDAICVSCVEDRKNG